MVLSPREARALLIAPLAAVALAAGFLLPLAIPAGWFTGIVLAMTVTGTIGGVIAYAAAILIGVPVHIGLRRVGWTGAPAYLLAGAAVSLPLALLVFWPSPPHDEGLGTLWPWSLPAGVAAAGPLVAGLFWRLARPDRPSREDPADAWPRPLGSRLLRAVLTASIVPCGLLGLVVMLVTVARGGAPAAWMSGALATGVALPICWAAMLVVGAPARWLLHRLSLTSLPAYAGVGLLVGVALAVGGALSPGVPSLDPLVGPVAIAAALLMPPLSAALAWWVLRPDGAAAAGRPEAHGAP